MRQSSRVKVLEGNEAPSSWQRCHRLIFQRGQSIEEARAAYGEDKIEKGDLVVIRTIVTPRFDEDGKTIHPKDWPDRRSDL